MTHGSCSIYKSGKLHVVPLKMFFQKILILQLYAMYVHADNVQTCYIYIKHLNEKGKYKAKLYKVKHYLFSLDIQLVGT